MPKNQSVNIPKKNNRASHSSLSLDAFVNAKNQRFVNTKKIENKRKVKKIVGQYHQFKQQSTKKEDEKPQEKSFYDMVFSGEVDIDAYNNYGVIQQPDEDLDDAELDNTISSYKRERPQPEQDHDKHTDDQRINSNNREEDNFVEEDNETTEVQTKREQKTVGKTKKIKKKDITLYKIPEFQEARQRYEEKQAEIEAVKKAKAERIQKLEQEKARRSQTKKKLAMKTSKGQPIMKNQLDLLLSKLQKKS